MTHEATRHEVTGRCLCGAVSFRGMPVAEGPRACHCGQCRRWSGHVWAALGVSELRIEGPLRWFASSETARRGFCTECGSALFWEATPDSSSGATETDVAVGALDGPTGLRLEGHIFVADKGDYYDIADGLPQWPQEAADDAGGEAAS